MQRTRAMVGSSIGALIRGGTLATALLVSACGSEDAESGNTASDVVARAEVSRADTLVLLLSVRLSETQQYLSSTELSSVHLLVDGDEWGTFAAQPAFAQSPDGSAGIWAVTDERNQALFVAALGEASVSSDEASASAGDFAALLRRQLPAGAHVAELAEVELTAADGTSFALARHDLIAFEVADGFQSALVGEVELSVSEGALP